MRWTHRILPRRRRRRHLPHTRHLICHNSHRRHCHHREAPVPMARALMERRSMWRHARWRTGSRASAYFRLCSQRSAEGWQVRWGGVGTAGGSACRQGDRGNRFWAAWVDSRRRLRLVGRVGGTYARPCIACDGRTPARQERFQRRYDFSTVSCVRELASYMCRALGEDAHTARARPLRLPVTLRSTWPNRVPCR